MTTDDSLGETLVPPPGAPSEVAVGACFGTFGELIQGILPPDGRDFLVTLPIARWSVATFRPMASALVTVLPPFKTKARTLVERIIEFCGGNRGGILTINSDIPVGKGMASSSADLVATARAVLGGFGVNPSPTTIEHLLRGIEPSDGVMYDGVVAFYHRAVRLHSCLGPVPPLTIVSGDEGGVVDTVDFNRRSKPFDAGDMAEYGRLLDRLASAVRSGDVGALGEVATRSAFMNQRLNEKRLLPEVNEICRAAGALGVVAAHSGTRIGILLSDDDPEYFNKLHRIQADLRRLSGDVGVDHTIGEREVRFCIDRKWPALLGAFGESA